MLNDLLERTQFDLRSLLKLSDIIEAKEIGILISGRFTDEKTTGHVLEFETDDNPQYLVRVRNYGIIDNVAVLYSQAEKLVARISNDKPRTYREEDLHLDKSGTPTPDHLLAPIERKFRSMYVKDNAANKLDFI